MYFINVQSKIEKKVSHSQNCLFQNDQILLEKTINHFFVCYNVGHSQFSPIQTRQEDFIYSFLLYLSESHEKSDKISVLFSSDLTVSKSHT